MLHAGVINVADAVDTVDTACNAFSGIDYIIINTCTVTAAADRKARHLIRKLKNANPKSKLIVTGCFAELNLELIKDIHADFIFSNSRKKEIADLICKTDLYGKSRLQNQTGIKPRWLSRQCQGRPP